MTSEAQKNRLYQDVQFLTEIRPFRHSGNMDSLNRVRVYLRNTLESLGLDTTERQWTVDGNRYTNIIATYNPCAGKRLVVGAHYDVCDDQPGADDNASGVAGLLETARLLSENKPELDYQIDLVAYCLEEPPYFATTKMGSYVHAKSLMENKVDVMGMICYDMIGYFSDEPNSQPYPSPELATLYPSTANFIIVVGVEKYKTFNNKVHALMAKDSGIDVQVISFPGNDGLAGLSDHRNYWKFGIPALMINDTAFIRNPNYHEKSDTIDTLDFDKMSEVVNSTYRCLVNME